MAKRVYSRVDERGIGRLIMSDEEGKNIFSDAFIADFLSSLDELEAEQPPVIMLEGLPEVFCGGADKENLMDLARGKIAVKDLVLSERLINTPAPVVAAMEGHAMGGGLVLGLCCDIMVMARESRYGAVFMSMGFTPGMGTTTLLREAVGPYVAAEMMYTGRRFRGRELAEKGAQVNHILPKDQVLSKALDVARNIAERNQKSLYLLKYAITAPKRKLLVDARLQEDMMHSISFGYPETKAAIDDLYAE